MKEDSSSKYHDEEGQTHGFEHGELKLCQLTLLVFELFFYIDPN